MANNYEKCRKLIFDNLKHLETKQCCQKVRKSNQIFEKSKIITVVILKSQTINTEELQKAKAPKKFVSKLARFNSFWPILWKTAKSRQIYVTPKTRIFVNKMLEK
jgi:hypothetical protein